MNIICVTTGSRPALLRQTLDSMKENSADWSAHTVTIVWDGSPKIEYMMADATFVINGKRQGASASRNIGAGSIPKYRRQERVMFCDDDCYFTNSWDSAIDETFERVRPPMIISGYAHPFNHPTDTHYEHFDSAGVISTVAMVMTWKLWDAVGPFDEPGGSGGSEDVSLCQRAETLECSFAVTKPQCIIHCGLTSSTGWPIVGARELEAMNNELILKNGLAGKVLMR